MTEENWADHIEVSVDFTGLFAWRLFEDVLAYPALDVVVLLSQFCLHFLNTLKANAGKGKGEHLYFNSFNIFENAFFCLEPN